MTISSTNPLDDSDESISEDDETTVPRSNMDGMKLADVKKLMLKAIETDSVITYCFADKVGKLCVLNLVLYCLTLL